jgi:GTP-binding protein EngB required for normal cell division
MTDSLAMELESIRRRTVSILEDLAEKNARFGLSTLPKELEECRKKFAANVYNVLVVGEAKRGKSSFINALIKRELLPTDVAIATNQVFRVSQVPEEAFRLRFDNDMTLTISEAEVREYGSQVVTDRKAQLRVNLDHLRWIEVDVPVSFLPPGVSLLDTPGLGSLYAAHAQITHRFIPEADAVIFVLDSNAPVNQFELQVLDTILSVTPYVFFIQTKIDLYDKEHWQAIQRRHQDILAERFGARLLDTTVWPISNRNLLKASEVERKGGNSTGFINLSRQPELSRALETFLNRVAGPNRCSYALILADRYYTTARKTLAANITSLTGATTQQLTTQQQQVDQLLQEFEADWGRNGSKRHDLLTKIQNIANASRQGMTTLIMSGGELETGMLKKIQAIKSFDEANQLGREMAGEIINLSAERWRDLCGQARQHYANLLGSLIEISDALLAGPEDPNLSSFVGPAVTVRDDILERLDGVPQVFVKGGTIALTMISVVAYFFPPVWGVALIGAAIGGIFGVVRNWGDVKEEHLAAARDRLAEHLSLIMKEVRKRFLDPDMFYNGMNLVNYHFDSLVRTAHEQIEDIVASRSDDVRKKSNTLQEQIAMDRDQRAAKKEELQQQLAEWDDAGRLLKDTNSQLAGLERELKAQAR